MERGEMEHDVGEEARGLLLSKHRPQRCFQVSVEIVEDEVDTTGAGVHFHAVAPEELRRVRRRTALRHRHRAGSRQRGDGDKEVACTVAFIFVIRSAAFPRLRVP
jgi:hypothetical protein